MPATLTRPLCLLVCHLLLAAASSAHPQCGGARRKGKVFVNINVTQENLSPCKKLLRIEVPVEEVDREFESVTRDFQKHVTLPGFRPGRAPREMVLRRFETDIESETRKNLISKAYKQVIEERNLDVVGQPDVEEIQFGRGQPMLFAVTMETAPEIELPEYKGLPVQLERAVVTEADAERALNLLREQRAQFQTVDRPAQLKDMVVINFSGTSEGKPLSELVPAAKGLNARTNFWVELGPNAFLPGFAEALLGARAGDRKTVPVRFPADFETRELAGCEVLYEIEVVEVKERVLPALDDEFAKSWGAENLEQLRAGVRRDLENELKYKQDKALRAQVIRALLNRVHFDLPESAVARETRHVVYDIVRENAERGVPRELIEKEKENIYAVATRNAKERVKLSFLIQKIAERENIRVSTEEIARRIEQLAALYRIPPDRLAKDLRKRDGLIDIYDQIAHEKVVDFLVANAKVEEAVPGTAPPV